MEYVYMMLYRHPEMPKGHWEPFAIVETEAVGMNWWDASISNTRKWYRQQGRLYCRTHYTGGEPVIYRIERWPIYTEEWVKTMKAKAS